MTNSPLVIAIANRLRAAGYEDVPTPFRVASVSFEFTQVLRGKGGRALDLVIVVDTMTGGPGETDLVSVRRRVETLSRALDVAGSRLVLTVILAGAATSTDIELLSGTCRVLVVEPIQVELDGSPQSDSAKNQLDDRIRLLLPLEVPPRDGDPGAGPTADEALLLRLPSDIDKQFLKELLVSSTRGEEVVTREVSKAISRRFKIENAP